VVFARAPGTIQGRVLLQGRTDHRGATVHSALSDARTDQETSAADGRFAIDTSHGEGFYTITASMPGYLSVESEHPVRMTVDSVVDLGEVTLVGGDVNGDDQIDVRDLTYVAWHFDEAHSQADVNGDGKVDILDLTLTAGNFGQVGPIAWPFSGDDSG
jgi:hypothetical protein